MASLAQSPPWLPPHSRAKPGQCGGLPGPGLPPQTVVPHCPPMVSVAPPHWPTCCSWLCRAPCSPRTCHFCPDLGQASLPSAEHLLTLLHVCLPLEGSCQLCSRTAPSPSSPVHQALNRTPPTWALSVHPPCRGPGPGPGWPIRTGLIPEHPGCRGLPGPCALRGR